MVTSEADRDGVLFAEAGGSRSSQAAGKRIFSDAVSAVDPQLSRRIETISDWRKKYIPAVRQVVEAGAGSRKGALSVASDGLESLGRHLTFSQDGREVPLGQAFDQQPEAPYRTAMIEGDGPRVGQLEVPYGGRALRGDQLRAQLDRWVGAGVMERSAADRLGRIIDEPSQLDLSDTRFLLLGAGSQMGPSEMLLSWGAEVVAVDLPREPIWARLAGLAKKGSGRMLWPTRGRDDLAGAGADLLTEGPQVASWLKGFTTPFIVGNYVYADGSGFVRLAGAVDALIASLQEAGMAKGLAYLATPTDVFAVPEDVVRRAKARYGEESRPLRKLLGGVTRSNLYAPNYRHAVAGEERTWGIADCLVPIQGANYALAKSLQRWRAVVSDDAGVLTSANIAPATRTASVIKNRMLAAAYGGAGRFGVEIFEPETSRALMAALLVHDIRNPRPSRGHDDRWSHPFDLFVEGAVHGGIWRLAYEPRSVLPIALVRGLSKSKS